MSGIYTLLFAPPFEFAVFFRDKIDSVRASTVSTPLYEVPSAGSGAHVVSQGDARADFAILVAVVQQVVDLCLFPVRFQESGGTSTA